MGVKKRIFLIDFNFIHALGTCDASLAKNFINYCIVGHALGSAALLAKNFINFIFGPQAAFF